LCSRTAFLQSLGGLSGGFAESFRGTLREVLCLSLGIATGFLRFGGKLPTGLLGPLAKFRPGLSRTVTHLSAKARRRFAGIVGQVAQALASVFG
jgi:hypothetical protein